MVADDGRMYRIDWKKAGGKFTSVAIPVGVAAAGGVGGALAGNYLGSDIIGAGDYAGVLTATGAVGGGLASNYIYSKWNRKSGEGTHAMYRDMPEYIQGEDGRMYRINWGRVKEIAKATPRAVKYAAAPVGLAVGGAMAGQVLGTDVIGAGDYTGAFAATGAGVGLAAGFAASNMAMRNPFRKKFHKGEKTSAISDTVGEIAGDRAGNVAYDSLSLTSFNPTDIDDPSTYHSQEAYENRDADSPPLMYRSTGTPEPIMPPSIITPAFGGNKRPKPPGFMPRMPGQRRRRR